MYLGYNTNGLAHHATLNALDVIAQLGYRGVGLTIDHHCLAPGRAGLSAEIDAIRDRLQHHRLEVVVETGGRYLLDPIRKHFPNLMSASPADQEKRVAFYWHALEMATRLGAKVVSLWSGIPSESTTYTTGLDRLVRGLHPILDEAARRSLEVAFEPEPGMFIERMEQFFDLDERLRHPALQLTLDIGHLRCVECEPIPELLRRWSARIRNIHLEDMVPGVHEHLFFGEGDIDFPAVFAALGEIGYTGGVFVELSRHSHMGPETARRSMEFLSRIVPPAR